MTTRTLPRDAVPAVLQDQAHLVFLDDRGLLQKLWGRLGTCGPIGNRPAWRLPTATQLAKLPHNFCRVAVPGKLSGIGPSSSFHDRVKYPDRTAELVQPDGVRGTYV